jgi:hypothetical protein
MTIAFLTFSGSLLLSGVGAAWGRSPPRSALPAAPVRRNIVGYFAELRIPKV